MTRNTKGNRESQRRKTLQTIRKPTKRVKRVDKTASTKTGLSPTNRLNYSNIGKTNRIRSPTGLESTIKIGAMRPTNATMLDAMRKGKVPKSVRALLLLALSHPYTENTQAAMDAAEYLQQELNKHKEKKSKSK